MALRCFSHARFGFPQKRVHGRSSRDSLAVQRLLGLMNMEGGSMDVETKPPGALRIEPMTLVQSARQRPPMNFGRGKNLLVERQTGDGSRSVGMDGFCF